MDCIKIFKKKTKHNNNNNSDNNNNNNNNNDFLKKFTICFYRVSSKTQGRNFKVLDHLILQVELYTRSDEHIA